MIVHDAAHSPLRCKLDTPQPAAGYLSLEEVDGMKLSGNKLSFLLYLIEEEEKECTVTKIARQFLVTKSTVSRAMDYFADQGLVAEGEGRYIRLTAYGRGEAMRYAKEVDLFSWWISQSADAQISEIRENAIAMSVNMGDSVKKQILSKICRNQLFDFPMSKEELEFSDFARNVEEGEYPVTFMISREEYKKDKYFSMADRAFRHPAVLRIRNGEGTIQLQAVALERRNVLGKLIQRGKLMSMDYEEERGFTPARKDGDLYSFPADVLGYVFHKEEKMLIGSCRLQFYAPLGDMKVHVKNGIFTMIIHSF